MYRKRNKGWLKHLDIAFLDLLCMQLCLAAAYYGRHRELSRLYRDSVYQNVVLLLVVFECLYLFFVDGYRDILKRGYYIEMVLVLMGCGSAVFAGGLADTVGAGVGTIGVALAFGLSVVAMAYAIGGISGCHINPAITLGVFLTGRMNGKDAGMYMIFQVIGAIIGSAILFALVATGAHDGPTATGSNGFGDGEMLQAFIAEAVFTFIFVLVVLGSTDSKKGAGNLAGLAIGLTLVLVHIVCIPITGTSVNPARSIAPALFQGGEALSQLWLFIIAPFVGAALSAVVWNYLGDKK